LDSLSCIFSILGMPELSPVVHDREYRSCIPASDMVLDRYATGLHFPSCHCCDSIPVERYFEASVLILVGARGSK